MAGHGFNRKTANKKLIKLCRQSSKHSPKRQNSQKSGGARPKKSHLVTKRHGCYPHLPRKIFNVSTSQPLHTLGWHRLQTNLIAHKVNLMSHVDVLHKSLKGQGTEPWYESHLRRTISEVKGNHHHQHQYASWATSLKPDVLRVENVSGAWLREQSRKQRGTGRKQALAERSGERANMPLKIRSTVKSLMKKGLNRFLNLLWNYQCVRRLGPVYLADALQPVARIPGRQR